LIDYSIHKFAKYPSVSFVDGTPISYAELGHEIDQNISIVVFIRLKPGDKVALLGHNMPNWVIAYFAVVSRGMIIVPILPDFTREEIDNVLVHSEAKALFVTERLAARIDELEWPNLSAKISLDQLSVLKGEVTENQIYKKAGSKRK